MSVVTKIKEKPNNLYKNVKKNWLNNSTPNSDKVIDAKKFIDYKGNVYKVDNKKDGVLFDYNSKDYKESKKCAKLFEKTFGGKIEMQPIVNKKKNISACDFKWLRPNQTKFETWDLKTINGNKNRTLDNAVKNKKEQSNNFIFDIKNHTLTKEQSIKQIKHIFKDKQRNWIKHIILKDDEDIIAIYEKNE